MKPLKLLLVSDLHFTAGLAQEIDALQDQLPPGEYDHMQEGRLFWHNEMLVDEMDRMLGALAGLAARENPALVVFLGDMVSTNWSVSVEQFAGHVRDFTQPLACVTGNHDIYLQDPACRVQDVVVPGQFDSGIRWRLFDRIGLIFLDIFVKYGCGEYRKWLDPEGDVAGLDYRPQDVEQALAILDDHPDRTFLVFGHFPMCDPSERIRVEGRRVGRGAAAASPLRDRLIETGNLAGIVTGHQHFNHLQDFEHGFHWTVPSLVEYPCAAAILDIDPASVTGRLVLPDESLQQRSFAARQAGWTYGLPSERHFSFSFDPER